MGHFNVTQRFIVAMKKNKMTATDWLFKCYSSATCMLLRRGAVLTSCCIVPRPFAAVIFSPCDVSPCAVLSLCCLHECYFEPFCLLAVLFWRRAVLTRAVLTVLLCPVLFCRVMFSHDA